MNVLILNVNKILRTIIDIFVIAFVMILVLISLILPLIKVSKLNNIFHKNTTPIGLIHIYIKFIINTGP